MPEGPQVITRAVVTGLMLGCALIVTGAVVHRIFRGPTYAPSAGPSIRTERNWERYAVDGQVLGADDAPVTIIEFSDFQCPFCRRFADYHDSLTTLGISVKVIYRHLPAPNHPYALTAAIASECAGAQGRFEKMHDALFSLPDSLGRAPWWYFARIAGVSDSAAFERCLGNPQPRLAQDTAAGRRLKVRGTPTLLIHDQRVEGVPTFDSLVAYVRRASGSTN